MTKFGIVDVLGSRGDAEYADLVGDAIVLDVQGLHVQLLSLARLIEVKASAGRDKDLAVLPLLRATLARSSK